MSQPCKNQSPAILALTFHKKSLKYIFQLTGFANISRNVVWAGRAHSV